MTNYEQIGKTQERTIVKWARANGFPAADRTVRTGAGKDYGHRADEGDIWLAPGVIAQSKRLSPPNRAERAVGGWLAETEAQRIAAKADIALLIVRREGTTNVGEWWTWMRLTFIFHIVTGHTNHMHPDMRSMAVRMSVSEATEVLRRYGYGDPLETETTQGIPA